MSWRLDRLTETDSGASPICFCQAARSSAALLHGEQAELHDQPAAFGDRDEIGGRDRAAARMLPAQQRLEAGDAAGPPAARSAGRRG